MNNNKPYIKVTWRDYPENFTKEKLKRIKVYFQKKYNALSVKIEPEGVINKNDISLKSLETFNKIADTNYQKTLMKDFIKENKIYLVLVLRIKLTVAFQNKFYILCG